MFGVQGFRAAWAIDQHFKNLTVTTASLSLLVNYPHFLIWYKLAYSRGRAFITGHWWQLLAVPAAMLAIFAFAYAYYAVPVSQLPGVSLLSRDLSGFGNNARVISGPRLGDLLFGLTFNVMIFTVGWHYTKQVFGCMMVYLYFDRYKFSPRQRTITKYALLSIWWLNFAQGNQAGAQNNFSQFKYDSFDLPDVLVPITALVVAAGFMLVIYEVFWKNFRERGQVPSINMVVPFVALYVWWLPITRQYEFLFPADAVFPFAGQYLAFVYKMEDTRLRGLSHPEVRGTILGVQHRARRMAGVRVRAQRSRHRARHLQFLADVLLLHRGDVVHQHPPLLHRQRALALQGPGSAEIPARLKATPNLELPTPKSAR